MTGEGLFRGARTTRSSGRAGAPAGPWRIALDSGPPWDVSCSIEELGRDYLCAIQGGARRIGAVAVSRWQGQRARTESLSALSCEEEEVAIHAAHKLCKASRRSVTCVAGIQFDSSTRHDLDQILETAMRLIRDAARRLEDRRLRRNLAAPSGTSARIARGLDRARREIRSFLATPLDEMIQARAADGRWRKRFLGQVRLFAPLYVANACPNDCVYCGFRRSARFQRTKLSVVEAVEEARHLARQGHRTIDLVASEIATDRFIDDVARTTEKILAGTEIRCINLNLGSLSREQYGRLRVAGATGYHLYQETYDLDAYFQVHRSGLKRDMAYRLEAPRRAIEAGFERIGLGILLGLRAMEDDLAGLVRHARILQGEYPQVQLGFSLPRLQGVDAACEYKAAAPVSDEELIKAFLFLRGTFPAAHLTVTTRERPALRDRLIPLGITTVSAGVSTRPGGYTLDPGSRTAQFDIADTRPVKAIVEAIQRAGLTAVYG